MTTKTEPEVTHEMVVNLYNQYKYDHIKALRNASKIQRELTRAEHETNRIAGHLARIEAFCKLNNVALIEEL